MSSPKQLTYAGPKDPDDPTTIYVLPGPPGKPDEDKPFPFGQPIDVTAKEAKALQGDEAHQFLSGGVELDPDGDESGAPFRGYDQLDANEIVERIDDPQVVSTAQKAREIEAYEKDHDNRKMVVEAAVHQAEAYEVALATEEAEGVEGETG